MINPAIMSANNYLLITDTDKPNGNYMLTVNCADGDDILETIAKSQNLKELIKTANKEMAEVEYGLHFDI